MGFVPRFREPVRWGVGGGQSGSLWQFGRCNSGRTATVGRRGGGGGAERAVVASSVCRSAVWQPERRRTVTFRSAPPAASRRAPPTAACPVRNEPPPPPRRPVSRALTDACPEVLRQPRAHAAPCFCAMSGLIAPRGGGAAGPGSVLLHCATDVQQSVPANWPRRLSCYGNKDIGRFLEACVLSAWIS